MTDSVHETLEQAAADARQAYEDNKDRVPSFRMSTAGLPLLQQVLTNLVFPKLPEPFECVRNSSTLQKQVKREMAIGSGHLYSRVEGKRLLQEYPDYTYYSEKRLEWSGIHGTCDHLLVNDAYKRIVVVECKSLGVKSLTEAKETKLLTDNWGYLTQLCLYMQALVSAYPDYKIEGQWRVWAKGAERSFTHCMVWGESVQEVADRAGERHTDYQHCYHYWSQADVNNLVRLLVDSTCFDPLPLKNHYYGNLTASCALHFSPWSKALLDDDGIPYENLAERLTTLVEVSLGKSDDRKALALLDT
jgi:hypothetical protein